MDSLSGGFPSSLSDNPFRSMRFRACLAHEPPIVSIIVVLVCYYYVLKPTASLFAAVITGANQLLVRR
jgi:hypothetical protein